MYITQSIKPYPGSILRYCPSVHTCEKHLRTHYILRKDYTVDLAATLRDHTTYSKSAQATLVAAATEPASGLNTH